MSEVAQWVKNLPAMQEMPEILVRFIGQEDPLGGGHGNPLQYSRLKNPMDRGAWQATVHRVTKSQTRLKQVSTAQHTQKYLMNSQGTFVLHFHSSGLYTAFEKI